MDCAAEIARQKLEEKNLRNWKAFLRNWKRSAAESAARELGSWHRAQSGAALFPWYTFLSPESTLNQTRDAAPGFGGASELNAW